MKTYIYIKEWLCSIQFKLVQKTSKWHKSFDLKIYHFNAIKYI